MKSIATFIGVFFGGIIAGWLALVCIVVHKENKLTKGVDLKKGVPEELVGEFDFS